MVGDEIKIRVGVDATGLDKGMKKVEQTMRRTSAAIREIGRDMTFAITAPMLIMGRELLNTFNTFEKGLIGVVKTTGAVGKEVDTLRVEFQNLSKAIPVSMQDLLEIGVVAGQSAIALEDMAGFVKTAAGFASATGVDFNEAARELALFAQRTGTANSEIERLASTLVELGNKTSATEGDILHFLQPLTATGRLAGLSAPALAAMGSTLFVAGVRAEKAGTAFQKMFIRIENAIQSGGTDLELFAQISGKTANEFARDWKSGPEEAMIRFFRRIRDAEAPLLVLGEIVDDIRSTEAFAKFALSIEDFASSLELARKAHESGTASIQEAEAAYGSLANSMVRTMNTIEVFQTEFVEAFKEPIREIVKAIANFVEMASPPLIKFFQDMPDGMKKTMLASAALAAALGPLMFVLGSLGLSVLGLKQILPGLGLRAVAAGLAEVGGGAVLAGGGMDIAAASATLLKRSFKWMRGPAGLLATAIALGAVADNWEKVSAAINTETVSNAFRRLADVVFMVTLAIIKTLAGYLIMAAKAVIDAAAWAARQLSANWIPMFSGFFDMMAEGLENISFDADAAKKSLSDMIDGFFNFADTEFRIGVSLLPEGDDDPLKYFTDMKKILGEDLTLLGPFDATLRPSKKSKMNLDVLFEPIRKELGDKFGKAFADETLGAYEKGLQDLGQTFAKLTKAQMKLISPDAFRKEVERWIAAYDQLAKSRGDRVIDDLSDSLEHQVAVMNELDPVQKRIIEQQFQFAEAYKKSGADVRLLPEALAEITPEIEAWAENMERIANRINIGEIFADNFTSALEGVLQGTRVFDLFEIIKDTAITSFTQMFATIIKQKLGFDKLFIDNFNGLGEFLEGFAQNAGQILSQVFGAIGSFGGGGGGGIGTPSSVYGSGPLPVPVAVAAGGITSGPTSAIIGDNPSGVEAVIPLERFDEMFGNSSGDVKVEVINNAGADVSVRQVIEDERGKTVIIAVESAMAELQTQFTRGGPTVNAFRAGPLGRR